MKRIFITGDRAMPAFQSAQVVNSVLQKLVEENNGDLAVGTGTCANGIERAVRFLVPDEALNIASYELDPEGNIDFEGTFRLLEPVTDEVVFLHLDPLASHIGRALTRTFPAEKVNILLLGLGL